MRWGPARLAQSHERAEAMDAALLTMHQVEACMRPAMRRWLPYEESGMTNLQHASRAAVSRLGALSLVFVLPLFSLPGFASDVGCKPVFEATMRQLETPYHSHTTMMLVPGQKPQLYEQINTGKILYLLMDGKWTVSKITPQDMREQETDNIRNSKSMCSAVRDEPMDGVGATLYKVHEERDGTASDSQIWISKANGLPLRVKSEDPAFDSRYSYTDVVAPNVH
jgi:hypothetical protein